MFETYFIIQYQDCLGIWRTLGGVDSPVKCHSRQSAEFMRDGLEKDLKPVDTLIVKIEKTITRDPATNGLIQTIVYTGQI